MAFWSDWSDGKKWLMGILSALIIAALIGLAKFWLSGDTGVPDQRVAFSASSEPAPFAVKSTFEGTAVVSGTLITVEVTDATLSYPNAIGGSESRLIEDIRVSLAEAAEGAWRPVRRSNRVEVARSLDVGEVIQLEPFITMIAVEGLQSLAGYWLVFDIAERSSADPASTGLSHAHTRGDLF